MKVLASSPDHRKGFVSQLIVNDAWVYWNYFNGALARGELFRAPATGGPSQLLATAPQINDIVLDGGTLYFVQVNKDGSTDLVSLPASGGERKVLAHSLPEIKQLAVVSDRILLLEQGKLLSLGKDGTRRPAVAGLRHPTDFAISKGELFVFDIDPVDESLRLVRVPKATGTPIATAIGPAATLASQKKTLERAMLTGQGADLQPLPGEAFGAMSMVVDDPYVYWTRQLLMGGTEVWRTSRLFSGQTASEPLPMKVIPDGIGQTVVFADRLYFLGMDGVYSVSKRGGKLELVLDSRATALTASDRGVFIGTLDGQILRVDDSITH